MLQKKILMSAETSINNKSRFSVYLTPSLIFTEGEKYFLINGVIYS